MADAASDEVVTVIEPSRGWAALRLGELWAYRELLYFLTWRDVKVRYKQTVLGAAWAILQPVMTMIVFSLFFGRLAGIPSDGVPYPIFSFAALVPWTFFATALAQASNSLVGSANLIRKVYFPRLAVPISSVLAALVDFAIAMAVLFLMMQYYGFGLNVRLLWLPIFALLAVSTALGAGIWMAALNVEYRDVRFAVPFLVQLWMFATPIAYPSSLVPERYRVVFGLNPMVGVIEGFRWALLGTGPGPGSTFAVSASVSVVILVSGVIWFRRMERSFADVV